MMYMRGNPEDYDNWEALGNKGWNSREALKYFIKSEDYVDDSTKAEINRRWVEDPENLHGEGGYLTVQRFPYQPPISETILEGARELGYKIKDSLNDYNQTGFTIAHATVRNGQRLSVARAFLYPVICRTNLNIVPYAYVTRVILDSTGKWAVGVEYYKSSHLHKIFARKEIILSAGTIQTPQLLLLSGIGPREDLEKLGIQVKHDIHGVGKNLKNHVSFTIPMEVTGKKSETQMTDDDVWQYMNSRKGPMSCTGLSQVTGFVHLNVSDDNFAVPDTQIFFGGFMSNCTKTGKRSEEGKEGKEYFEILPTVLHPLSTGQITLRSSDPFVPPKIFAHYLSSFSDVKLLIAGVRFAQRLCNTTQFQEAGIRFKDRNSPYCSRFIFDTNLYWECMIRHYTNPENHQVGTAKMGPETDTEAVVDPQLRVYGIQNLRVIDASIMPTVPTGNLNAPVIMVAEKGSDLVKDTWITKTRDLITFTDMFWGRNSQCLCPYVPVHFPRNSTMKCF